MTRCRFCGREHNNVNINECHEAGCNENPENRNLSGYKKYKKVQECRFGPNRWAGESGTNRKRSLIKYAGSVIDFKTIKKCLIIGASNTEEKDMLIERGVEDAIAIDICVNCEGIIKMDMHSLKFPDNSFDMVFASHSLEHAFNFLKVVSEIGRVLNQRGYIVVEVPVNYITNDVDRYDFRDKRMLYDVFKGTIKKKIITILAERTLSVGAVGNFCSTDIAQVVLFIEGDNV